ELIGAGHAHEPRVAALVRAVGLRLRVRGRKEEKAPALDECAVLLGERRAAELLVEPDREAARVEPVLQRAHALVVDVAHLWRIVSPGAATVYASPKRNSAYRPLAR